LRKLRNEELHNVYFSPKIIRIVKSRRMRWAQRVTGMRVKRRTYRIFSGNARKKETTRKTWTQAGG
jgi:hypothetical protein